MKVVIIGSGNVATVLGKKIVKAGYTISQVAGRNPKEVAILAKELNANECYNLLEINTSADIYLIAVSDNAIAEIAGKISLPGKIVVHTAASISKEILHSITDNYGVIYPLQSLRKEIVAVPFLPVFVDGSNDFVRNAIQSFCDNWADKVNFANDEKRLKMHVSAVMVNNFTNHLYNLTEWFCQHEGLEFNQLYPIIEETSRRIKSYKPAQVQTGPAIRNDKVTIDKHLSLLSDYHQVRDIYERMTKSIQEFKKGLD